MQAMAKLVFMPTIFQDGTSQEDDMRHEKAEAAAFLRRGAAITSGREVSVALRGTGSTGSQVHAAGRSLCADWRCALVFKDRMRALHAQI